MPDDELRRRICAGVAEMLREERERQGLSLNSLASRAGLSRSMISYVEQQQRNPTLDTLLRITEVLGIDVETVVARARKRAGKAKA